MTSPLYRNVQRFRCGLVFKATDFVYHSTLGLRVIQKKKDDLAIGVPEADDDLREGVRELEEHLAGFTVYGQGLWFSISVVGFMVHGVGFMVYGVGCLWCRGSTAITAHSSSTLSPNLPS